MPQEGEAVSQGLVQPGEGMALGGQQQPLAPVGGDREVQLSSLQHDGRARVKGQKRIEWERLSCCEDAVLQLRPCES